MQLSAPRNRSPLRERQPPDHPRPHPRSPPSHYNNELPPHDPLQREDYPSLLHDLPAAPRADRNGRRVSRDSSADGKEYERSRANDAPHHYDRDVNAHVSGEDRDVHGDYHRWGSNASPHPGSEHCKPRVRTEDEPLKERALALAEQLADGKEALEALILQKRRLSSFLLTPPDAESKPLRGEDRDEHLVRPLWPPSAGDRLVANVPASVSPDSVHGEIEHLIGTQTVIDCEAATYPVYFLPKVMLPAQDDQLMHQEDSCDKGIDDARDEWDATAAPLQNELGEILTTLASRRSRSRSPRRTSAAPRERERT